MDDRSAACAARLRLRFTALVPPGNIETLYLRPIIEDAQRVMYIEGLVDNESGILARIVEGRLRRTLAERSRYMTEPLVSTSELRAILLDAIG